MKSIAPPGKRRDFRCWRHFSDVRRQRYFEVIGCQTGKRYRIYHGYGANFIELELDDAALPRTGWCFVPSDHLIAGDVMLAQKIALETDKRGALASANKFFTLKFDFAAVLDNEMD